MKKRIIAASAVAAAVAVALAFTHLPRAEAVTYTDAEASAYTMEQTLTAAGQIRAASTEEIAFSTSKTFAGMCVEEGDAVRQGQHLISYSDGTYEDAPANGVISDIDAPQTGSVAEEDNTLTLSETDELILEISVPEDEIGKLAKGDEAKITVNADSSKTFNGTITSIKALSADLLDEAETDSTEDGEASGAGGESSASGGFDDSGGSTAYYAASLELINDGTLKPGMSASCTVTISHRSVLAVPIEAVQFDEDDAPYVETVSGSGVEKTSVTIGESDANYVEITEGLSEGDQVRIEVRR
ncbi:MAG: HlyD family efflux transporter periplasmic adaptor subunit [Firmicutes bacterium]|nr:HlyD family efflux transporter periplasmic adaptor subunit [Bacillota bacterium]